eukprot:CAMPEP_0201691340 /NCGR_PEP_ID=MMETSP0578-20130828/4513_1 /ASSEMBLY_ACC=CAM_ASM_000663 /TAXON_ID=267565 /ORGANISM="Skeletonema grethea, Strain CCMP 1804" /LENGTH=490 /DNA_ID=CAMNT_0048176521 /DNA_START=73 /DNA_END=1548 /DNA_ORIENTATION=+
MSEGNNNTSESMLSKELFYLCNSWSLSTDRLHKSIQRHGFKPNDPLATDYKFFLRACINKTITEEIIQWLLEYFPAAISATDYIGQSPLHYACANEGMNLGIVQLLIDAEPNSVGSVDNHGRMPLHVLRVEDETAELEILRLLIEKCPEAVRHANNRNLLPIHIAANTARPTEFCRMLIKAFPGSEQIASETGELPLHYACHGNTVDTVQYLFKLYPDAVNHKTVYGMYPIGHAIQRIAYRSAVTNVFEIVKFLLDCDRNVQLQKLRHFSLLHYTCRYDYNDSNVHYALEVIKEIYDAHPEGIEGDQNKYHQEIAAFLNRELAYFYQAKDQHLMTTPNENGRLPLHTALQNNARIGSIKLLVKGNSTAIKSPDNSGALPLHIACEHYDSLNVIKYLVGLDATAVGALDKVGNAALHYACRGTKYETIALLLEDYNAVFVSKRNAHGKLPLDLLWESSAVKDRESVEYTESVFRLLRACPGTVMNMINVQK